MDFNSSFVIVGSIVVFIILVTVLVILFYKPGKKLEVYCEYKSQQWDSQEFVKINVKNTGKKQVKMMSPFVDFYNLQSSQIYQIDPKKVHCKFPRLLQPGDEVSCEVEIGHYRESLKKSEFHPHKVKIFVKDTVGLKFNSNSMPYKA